MLLKIWLIFFLSVEASVLRKVLCIIITLSLSELLRVKTLLVGSLVGVRVYTQNRRATRRRRQLFIPSTVTLMSLSILSVLLFWKHQAQSGYENLMLPYVSVLSLWHVYSSLFRIYFSYDLGDCRLREVMTPFPYVR